MAQQRISSPVLYNKQPFGILKYTFSVDLTEAPKPIAKQAINTMRYNLFLGIFSIMYFGIFPYFFHVPHS